MDQNVTHVSYRKGQSLKDILGITYLSRSKMKLLDEWESRMALPRLSLKAAVTLPTNFRINRTWHFEI